MKAESDGHEPRCDGTLESMALPSTTEPRDDQQLSEPRVRVIDLPERKLETLSSDHARADAHHVKTAVLFTDARERQGCQTNIPISSRRKGLFPADMFLPSEKATVFGIGRHKAEDAPLSGDSNTNDIESSETLIQNVNDGKPVSSRKSDAPPSMVMSLARIAFQRTIAFQEWLIQRTPPELRSALEKDIRLMPGPPKNLPSQQVVQRFTWFANTLGYFGPVLWFMPPSLSLEHLRDADLLDARWWSTEHNFLKGLRTICPYDPDEFDVEAEPGYWALALPGIMPGTANRSYAEQASMLESVARTAGLKTCNGSIAGEENMRVMVRSVADVAVFFAMAQFAGVALTNVSVSVRTSTVLKSYQSESGERSSSSIKNMEKFSLYEKCQVCVQLRTGHKLEVHDMGDTACAVSLGIAPFFVPFIY